MAKKELVENIVKLYSKLGGNMNDVLGSRSNVTFLGTGKNPEPFVEMDINMEAVGVLGKSKILEELKSPMGYLTADKLNDVQATKLYNNMLKLEEFYYPKQVSNITDMATGTRNLDQEGLGALRAMADDLPPPGSRGGPDDIAAPFASANETIANLQKQDPELAAQFRTLMTNKGDMPGKRASAREFLVEALKKDVTDKGVNFGKTQLNDVISAEDVRYITEGGGGIGGDPIMLVEKYFGPRIVEALPAGATGDDIIRFTKKVLEEVVDASGNRPSDPKFDRMTAKFIDEMADGGRAGFSKGKIVKSGLEDLAQLLQKEKNRTQRIAGNLRLDNMQRTEIGKPKKGVDYDYYRELLDDDEVNVVMGDETKELLEAMLKEQKAEMDYMFRLYKKGALNPTAGETTMGRLKMLEEKAQSGVPLSVEEIAEIKRLSEIFNKAEGGRAGFRFGKSAGKAFGLAKKLANINKSVDEGVQMGYQDLRKYGLEAEDITRLFKELAMDKTMVGPEKTAYFKMLNQVLKNPDDFPDGIIEIKKRLGLDFADGGRAGFRLGKSVFSGIANMFKKGADDIDLVKQEETFRTGPITEKFLGDVDKRVIDKFIRTRDTSGPGSFGMYDNIAEMPQGLQAAEFIKRVRVPGENRIDYEKAEMFIGGGIKLTGKETIDELIEMYINAMKSYKSPFKAAKGGLAKILEV